MLSNYTEQKTWFRRLLCHPARKRIGPILQLPRPTWRILECTTSRMAMANKAPACSPLDPINKLPLQLTANAKSCRGQLSLDIPL